MERKDLIEELDNITDENIEKAKECFKNHDVELNRYEHHFRDVDVEYMCNTCGNKIDLSYKLIGASIKEEK